MVKKILNIYLYMLIMGACLCLAQESPENMDAVNSGRQESEIFNVRDFRSPFLSWLPLEENKEQPGNEKPLPNQPGQIISAPSLNIQGLIWNSELPQAIVDGQVLKIGDTVQGSEIINIGKEGITVKYQGKEFIVSPQVEILNPEPKSGYESRYERMGGMTR